MIDPARIRFVLDFVIRLNPDPNRVADAVARAEAVWAELKKLGYGVEAPPPPAPATAPAAGPFAPAPAPASNRQGGWNGPYATQPTAGPGGHPAYTYAGAGAEKPKPSLEQQLRNAHADVATWKAAVARHPGNEQMQALLDQSRATLAGLLGQRGAANPMETLP